MVNEIFVTYASGPRRPRGGVDVRVSRSGVIAVLRRPSLWATALVTLADLAPNKWWRTPPFLPIPDRRALDWRITTAYGDTDTALDEHDLVAYLEWRQRAARGSGG